MNILLKILTIIVLLTALSEPLTAQQEAVKHRTPGEIVAQSTAQDWRTPAPENTLYVQLPGGTVVLELAPQLAPLHVDNTRKLVRDGVFDNTSFYRVIDGFVAQGGPQGDAPPQVKTGQVTIAAEFTRDTAQHPVDFVPLDAADGYADSVGFVDGFAAARTRDGAQTWAVHCYGALGMGRANESDSGGTELYVVIGHAQRYLDRNTTVFGRVLDGMDVLQKLDRSSALSGAQTVGSSNRIVRIRVGSDLPPEERRPLQVMKTNSDAFRALMMARKNRRGEWFVHAHNHIDVCAVPVPVRLAADTNTQAASE